MGAKRPLNGTSKVNRHTNGHTDTRTDGQTDRQTFPLTPNVPAGTSDPIDACSPDMNASTCDQDGDGLTNAEEITAGTDPTNADSDGDGFTDGEEVTGTDDPSTPNVPAGTSDPVDACSPDMNAPTCDQDGDGLTNAEEITAGTDPTNADSDGDGFTDGEEVTGTDDPATPNVPTGTSDGLNSCDPIANTTCLPVANNDVSSTDPGVTITFDITGNDMDPDGTIDDTSIDLDPSTPGQQTTITITGEGTYTANNDGTITFVPDPNFIDGTSTITYTVSDNNGNVSNEASITIVVPLCPNSNDTDSDGLLDCDEINGPDGDPLTPDGSDPNNADSDGDGYTDGEEVTGTDDPSTPNVPVGTSDPLDACSPDINADICDQDGDGLTNAEEITAGTDPTNADSDGDGFTDGEEVTGTDDPSTPNVPAGTSDPIDACSPDMNASTCDQEAIYIVAAAQNVDTYILGESLATVTDIDGTITSATLANGTMLPSGTTIDPVTGEITVTDPLLLVAGAYTIDIMTTDANGGITTQTVTLVFDPVGVIDSDGDGINDGDEVNGPDGDPTTDDGTDPNNPDTDGDGITDGDEVNGNPNNGGIISNPNNPCDPNSGSIPTGDCDGDGVPNGIDPNPSSPETSDDSEVGSVDDIIEIDILSNDDYLSNNDSDSIGTIDIVQVGGNAGGTIDFDPLTGILSYRPLTIEQGTTVTIEYRVCNTDVNPEVCSTSTVFITINPIESLIIPEGISPNGDGINDVFVIENLEILYPNFSMEIINRWGNIVYKYTHNGDANTSPQWWDGYSNGRMTLNSNEIVPTGTYFYSIYFNQEGKEPQAGWIYLRK